MKLNPPMVFGIKIMEALTNEQAKQKAVILAWGEHWNKIKFYTNFNGCISFGVDLFKILKGNKDIIELTALSKTRELIPTSLIGISTNNGWTRIEPDNSNLPKDSTIMYQVGTLENGKFTMNSISYTINTMSISKATHFRPEPIIKPPIY